MKKYNHVGKAPVSINNITRGMRGKNAKSLVKYQTKYGSDWSPEDWRLLIGMIISKTPRDVMARRLSRTVYSVDSMVKQYKNFIKVLQYCGYNVQSNNFKYNTPEENTNRSISELRAPNGEVITDIFRSYGRVGCAHPMLIPKI